MDQEATNSQVIGFFVQEYIHLQYLGKYQNIEKDLQFGNSQFEDPMGWHQESRQHKTIEQYQDRDLLSSLQPRHRQQDLHSHFELQDIDYIDQHSFH
jgi:hypothetical protein